MPKLTLLATEDTEILDTVLSHGLTLFLPGLACPTQSILQTLFVRLASVFAHRVAERQPPIFNPPQADKSQAKDTDLIPKRARRPPSPRVKQKQEKRPPPQAQFTLSLDIYPPVADSILDIGHFLRVPLVSSSFLVTMQFRKIDLFWQVEKQLGLIFIGPHNRKWQNTYKE